MKEKKTNKRYITLLLLLAGVLIGMTKGLPFWRVIVHMIVAVFLIFYVNRKLMKDDNENKSVKEV